MEFKHAKTKVILKWFEEISKIPRCSGNEAGIADYLGAWAEKNGFGFKRDKVNNVLILVPGSAGYEKAPTVVVQGHMDMVCEKSKGATHDFKKDPIQFDFEVEPGWLRAKQTTLGADNGIAIAMAMAAATEHDVAHPPMELLFTVDEETGLTGATALEPGFLKGKYLLNVDSEDEGVFTVGCAGGKDTHLRLPVSFEPAPAGMVACKIVAEGMKGGHSGVDIHQQRANAIHMAARALITLLKNEIDLRIAGIAGGTAHNAIPRDVDAVIYLPESALDKAKSLLGKLDEALKAENTNNDPKVTVRLDSAAGAPGQVLTASDTRKVVDFILAIPHGVAAMSTDIAGLVETSNNLATVKIEAGKLELHTSQRSSIMERLDNLTDRIEAIGRLAGAEVETGGGYPAWKPNMDSALLARCKEIYKRMFDKEPVVEIIHAGLECGIIGSKYDGMDMISFGPTIKNPHSPDEKIQVDTIGQVWDFFVELLKSFK